MKTNVRKQETTPGFTTHEGAPAVKESAEKELRRAASCLLLFEDTFYESGSAIAERIKDLCGKVSIAFLADLAVTVRRDLKLRHAALWLALQLLPKKGTPAERNLVGGTISAVIERADELAEILALYWIGGKKPLPRQLKAGIAKAFPRFSAYNLGKYNRDAKVKLRDALFLSHAKPKDEEQAGVWKRLVDGTLESPDTWEVQLSAGKDKKETFERLMKEEKLGYMALLRNLRNMEESGVDRALVRESLLAKATGSKALPFRFVAAAWSAPSFAQDVSDAMLLALKEHAKLPGRTGILVDVSGSMNAALSGKSKLNRIDAASALAVLLREISDARVFAYANDVAEIPCLRGIGLVDSIRAAMPHLGGGTETGKAISLVASQARDLERLIVVTDEQAHDTIPHLIGMKGYILNVAPYEPALPTKGGLWTRISGFSERVVDWIRLEEKDGALHG